MSCISHITTLQPKTRPMIYTTLNSGGNLFPPKKPQNQNKNTEISNPQINSNPKMEEHQNPIPSLSPSFPLTKIKRIIKLDQDINKSTSESTILISLATQLFLQSLTDGARKEVLSRKRRVVRFEDVKSAVRAHQPTADFLLNCLSELAVVQPRGGEREEGEEEEGEEEEERELPRGTRRIDQIFQKVAVEP